MSVSLGNIAALEAAIQQLGVMFTECSVDLKEGGTIKARAHVGIRSAGGGMRSARASELTGAVDQEVKLAVILADDWDTKSPGRPPKKGDIITFNGQRSAFERVHLAAPAGNKMLYKAELKG
jgi:hypothetical protein